MNGEVVSVRHKNWARERWLPIPIECFCRRELQVRHHMSSSWFLAHLPPRSQGNPAFSVEETIGLMAWTKWWVDDKLGSRYTAPGEDVRGHRQQADKQKEKHPLPFESDLLYLEDQRNVDMDTSVLSRPKRLRQSKHYEHCCSKKIAYRQKKNLPTGMISIRTNVYKEGRKSITCILHFKQIKCNNLWS